MLEPALASTSLGCRGLARRLIPYLAECLLDRLNWAPGVPVYLLLHGVGVVGVFLLYQRTIRHQGKLLQAREQHILEVLTRD